MNGNIKTIEVRATGSQGDQQVPLCAKRAPETVKDS